MVALPLRDDNAVIRLNSLGPRFTEANSLHVIDFQLTLPPWPIYRRSPIQWQKPRADAEPETKEAAPAKEKKSSRRKEKAK